MLVSLYTSRVVLNTLGVEDYGIYNVVGGVVAMLSFFNSSMATSTQRYLNYEMGKGNTSGLRKIFSNAINTHFLIGVVTVILLETIGLWFVYSFLNIPEHKFDAAIIVYHCSVASLFISITSTPYNSAIIANEKMNVYAYFSIVEVLLKLLIVYLLLVILYNKLIVYAFLMLGVTILMRLMYGTYCVRKFPECKYQTGFDKPIVKEMLSFSGWMLFGTLSDMLSKQGINLLINIFFGPIFNASRAIAVQVQSAISSFSTNFMTAVKPQIIKSYSSKDYDYMYKLVFTSSKVSFFLLFILTMPILLYTEEILQLWLKQVPDMSPLFTRLVLIEILISSAYSPIAQVNQASGRIKNYQLAISLLFLTIFFLTLLVFKLGFPVYSTFIISVFFAVIGLFIRILILRKENFFPAKVYLSKVILPLIPVVLISISIPVLMYKFLPHTIIYFLLNIIAGLTLNAISIWLIGLNKSEKVLIKNGIKSFI